MAEIEKKAQLKFREAKQLKILFGEILRGLGEQVSYLNEKQEYVSELIQVCFYVLKNSLITEDLRFLMFGNYWKFKFFIKFQKPCRIPDPKYGQLRKRVHKSKPNFKQNHIRKFRRQNIR